MTAPQESLPYNPDSTLNCTLENVYADLEAAHDGDDLGRRVGKLSVLLEHTDTLTTENTRLTDVSRVTTRQSIRSSVFEKPAAFIRRIKQFFRRRYVGGGGVLGAVHPKLPVGILDITKGLQKDDFRTSVASGAFASIFKCHWHHDKKSDLVAVKVLHIPLDQNSGEKLLKRLEHEMTIWAVLRHENILPFFGFCAPAKSGGLGGMVSPWLASGCLHDYIRQNGEHGLTVTRRLKMLCDTVSGLSYLHSHSIIHGDLTSMNVLINDDGSACLSDFGLSVMTADLYGLSFLSSKLGGAAQWAAPEIFPVGEGEDEDDDDEGRPQLSVRSDIYSFGCIVFEVMTNKLPWRNLKPQTVIWKLTKKQKPRRPRPEHAPLLTDQIWDYISTQCWATDPEERPSTAEAKSFVNDLHDESLHSTYYAEPLHEL